MKVIGENIKEVPVKESGDAVYYTNSDGDLAKVVFTNKDSKIKDVTLVAPKRLKTQRLNKATYNPKRKAGLQLWAKKDYEIPATGAKIDRWGDLSGNVNDLVGTSHEPTAIYGYANFSGIDQYLTLTTPLSLSEFTICFAVNSNPLKSNDLVGKTTDANSFISTSYISTRGVTVSLASGEIYSTSGGEVPIKKDCLITVIKNASNELYVRVNGIQVHNETATATALQIDEIGRLFTNTETFIGNMYEIAIYNAALTGDDLSAVELGMISRNRITV